MPLELIFEIGTEEIPAGFLQRGLAALEEKAQAAFTAARLAPNELRVLGTPRRMALLARGMPEAQADVREEVVGPPAQAAFDAAGAPTKAAIGFAAKNGADIASLRRGTVPGKKGEYVLCERLEKGRGARDVLPALLEELCRSLPWQKSMRWGFGTQPFARPVQWLVALLGGEVVHFEFAGIASGRESRGHRFLASKGISLDGSAENYVAELRNGFVIVDPEERANVIRAELSRVEKEAGIDIRKDSALLDEVVNLVEYPVAICGAFDPAFLEVPEEVVVSAMRAHQRYFSTEKSGRLAPHFVTIAGTITRDVKVVRAGNERVLAARLSDAKFFFREDLKSSLEAMGKKLEGVVFQTKLGSVAAKVERIANLALKIADRTSADRAATLRAAHLCKADLVSHMVGEFPDLQGVMGRYYARAAGESDAVATAIEEHYLPRGSGGKLPGSDVAAAVAIADRVDTLVGCFAAGLAPTGSADPYGLRRAALSVLAILLDRRWSALPLSELLDDARAQISAIVPVDDKRAGEVREFLRVRLRGLLEGMKLSVDCVDAALAAGFDDVPDALARAEAVSALRNRDDFEPLATAFKRVANILKGDVVRDGAPDPAAFVEEDERALWDSFLAIEKRVERHLEGRDYQGALQVLAELKTPVDRFFEKVLVMDKDERVKKNRLAMLGRINATFNRIADFRQLAVTLS